MPFKKISLGRIIEPLLLGSIANITINYIFNPNNPDFIVKEFVVAFLFAIVITEINRELNIRMEKKYSWTNSFGKRFMYHLAYLTIFLLLVLNILGNAYMWMVGDSFHDLSEMLIINVSVLILAVLLTTQKWAIHFYQSWRNTENHLRNSNQKLDVLQLEIEKSSVQIELTKGSNLYKVNVEDIQYAKIEHGIVWVRSNLEKEAIFNGTLGSLYELLPEYSFFQITRNIIVHRDSILVIASSDYGKIEIKLKEELSDENPITVSRLKASLFRKWYHSSSPII